MAISSRSIYANSHIDLCHEISLIKTCAPQLARPPSPGPCLDFGVHYALIRNNWSKKIGVEYWAFAPLICTLIIIGCHCAWFFYGAVWKCFRVASARFFQGGSLRKAGFHTCRLEKKSSEYPRKIRAWRHPRKIRVHPIKIWVAFTGYPSNHFSGCRLNGRMCT